MFELCPISFLQLSSIQGVAAACESNKSKFLECHDSPLIVEYINGEYFFLLMASDLSYKGDATDEVLAIWRNLLQNSPAFCAMKSAALYGTNKPSFLNWLSYNIDNDSLSVCDTPNYLCVMSTFLSAQKGILKINDIGVELTERSVVLLLEAPQQLNVQQLEFILYTIADSYEKLLVNSVNSQKLVSSLNQTQYLTLHVMPSSSLNSYSIELWQDTYGVLLQKKNINNRMKAMEPLSSPISLAAEQNEVSTCYGEIPCAVNLDGSLQLFLMPNGGNTYEFDLDLDDSTSDLSDAQLIKILRKREEKIAYLPKVELLLSVVPDDPFLQFIEHEADKLCAISQSYIAKWIVDTNVKTLNAATLLLLRKVQDGKPFTLPGTQELIGAMLCVLSLLKSNASVYSKDNDLILLEFLKVDSLEALKKVRSDLSKSFKQEISTLYCCALDLSDGGKMQVVRQALTHQYGIEFEGKHNIPFAPEETMYVIIRFLHLLTQLYKSVDAEDGSNKGFYTWFDKVLANHLLNDGIWLHFIFQKHLALDHFIKTWGLPLSLLGVTFDMRNEHDGRNMLPDYLWTHDCFDHPLFINTIIDKLWKLDLNDERQILIQNLDELFFFLLKSDKDSYKYCGEEVTPSNLLLVLKGLFFILMHEQTLEGSHTHTRILPSSFSPGFLEKQLSFFVLSLTSISLDLDLVYRDFPQALKELLPIEGQSRVPFCLAIILLDVFVQKTQECFDQGKSFNVDAMMVAFREKCAVQEKFVKLLAKDNNWDKLLASGALPSSLVDKTTEIERVNTLNLPNIQRRLASTAVLWELDEGAVA